MMWVEIIRKWIGGFKGHQIEEVWNTIPLSCAVHHLEGV